MFPKVFMKVYLEPMIYTEYGKNTRNTYVISLLETLPTIKPLAPLKPNRELYELAKCHAITSGKTGYTGHKRQKSCKNGNFAECCSYGCETGLEVIYQLLLDDGVPSLGHRYACLNKYYTTIGISMQPHKKYGINAVLDFR
jgi:uncharacterized protein YkwD